MRVTRELSALASVLSPSLVQEALIAAGKQGERAGKLPPDVVFWLVVGMGLYRSLNIQEVLSIVADGANHTLSWGPDEKPCSTSVTHARDRLGPEAVRSIFRAHAASLDVLHNRAPVWHGLNVYALDGTTFRAPDTEENWKEFDGPRVRGRRAAYPQLRAVVLANAFTRLVTEVVLGPYSTNELKLSDYMLERLRPGTLLLLDRAFHTFVWAAQCTKRNVAFVVRAKSGSGVVKARHVQQLGPGDELRALGSAWTRRKHPDLPAEVQVRFVTRNLGTHTVTVLTNLLSPDDYPADEIIALYRERWEVEFALRELKTEMGELVLFRSKRPERVLQEAYGLLTAFNCVHALMCEAAQEVDVKPTALSFTGCLTALRRVVSNAPGQRDAQTLCGELVTAFSRNVLPPRRPGRSYPRWVKPRPFKYSSNRAGQPPGKSRRQKQGVKREQRRNARAGVSKQQPPAPAVLSRQKGCVDAAAC